MINLASVMTGADFWKTGVTLEDLDIDHMDKGQINTYLRDGIYGK